MARPRYEWGNKPVAQFREQIKNEYAENERLVLKAKARYAERLAELEQAKLKIDGKEKMLNRHLDEMAKKAAAKNSSSEDVSVLYGPEFSVLGLVRASLLSLRATQMPDLLVEDIDEAGAGRFAKASDNLALEKAVEKALALVGSKLSVEQQTLVDSQVVRDVRYCRDLVREGLGQGKRRQAEIAVEIHHHFQASRGLGPCFGLDDHIWRGLVDSWRRTMKVPDGVVRIVPGGFFKGDKANLVISSGRFFRTDKDTLLKRQISPAVVLDHILRKMAGVVIEGTEAKIGDPLKELLRRQQEAVSKYSGKPQEVRARRALLHAKSIAPFLLANGLIHAAKRLRDRDPGRFAGECGALNVVATESIATRRILAACRA